MSPFLSALALLLSPPNPKNLAEYLTTHPWNAAENGPLLVLEPERARLAATIATLGSYGRKKVPLGSLTTLVLPTRIDIDDSLSQKPNLYEGLPKDAKVLYLLRSLSDAQWQIAGSRGIGLGDLRGEQALVFASLLPKRFAWRSNQLDKVGFWGKEGPKGTLSDLERERVRLRIERTVEMQVYFQSSEGSTSSWRTDRYHGAPGSLSYQRNRDDEYVPNGAFGLEVRKVAPNVPKPSELNTTGAAFDIAVAVPAKTTVGQILRTLGPKIGAEIIPDFRVADRTVTFYGGKASARDLLAALALSVEGTYRRVGSAYVLTSDLAGMGARELKLALWEDRLRRDTWQRENEWRKEIGGKGGFAKIGFSPDGPEVGSKATELIDQGDQKYGSVTVDPATLGPELRRFIDQWDKEYTQQPIRKDKVGLSSAFAYRFVMPDGRALDVEGNLGPAFTFRPQPASPSPQTNYEDRLPKPPFAVPSDKKMSFRVAAEDSATAVAAIRAIGRLPGSEVWLGTHSQAILAAAIEAAKPLNVSVGLALRPWRGMTNEPDRNIAGDFGPTLRTKIGEPAPDQPLREDLRPLIGTWMAPTDPAIGAAWHSYGELATQPGLAGIMLLESQPFGYEPTRERWMSSSQPLDWLTVGHGYTVAQRLAFLRKEGIDPIDIGDDGVHTTPDLRQTYFFDDALRGSPSVYDGTDDTHPKTREVASLWRKELATANRTAVERLVTMLGGRGLWFEQRLPNINSLGRSSAMIVAWHPGEALPTVSEGRDLFSGREGYFPVRLDVDSANPGYSQLRAILGGFLTRGGPPTSARLLLDLDGVPSAKIEATLQRWLKPANPSSSS